MLKKNKTYLRPLVTAVLLLFAISASVPVYAQKKGKGRRKPAAAMKAAEKLSAEDEKKLKALDDEIKKIDEELTKVTKSITENCTALKEGIDTSRASSSELPYDQNDPHSNFQGLCEADGTLTWTAIRVFASDDLERTSYAITTSAIAGKLSGYFAENSFVRFVSDTPTIKVEDTTGELPQLEWRLDLRKDELATKFVKDLGALVTGLKAKKKLEKQKADLVAQKAQLPGGA